MNSYLITAAEFTLTKFDFYFTDTVMASTYNEARALFTNKYINAIVTAIVKK